MTRTDSKSRAGRSAVLPALVALIVSIGRSRRGLLGPLAGAWWGAVVLLGVLALRRFSAIRLWRTRALRLGWFVATLSCLVLTLLGGGLAAALFVALRSIAAVPFDRPRSKARSRPASRPWPRVPRELRATWGERSGFARSTSAVRRSSTCGVAIATRRPRPLGPDTMVNVFSATKGLAP